MYKFLLRKKIKQIIKHSERTKAYHNLKEIKSVLVLFDTENFDDANYFIQQMRKMGKKVKAFAFKNKKDTGNYSNISYTIVTGKDMKSESLLQIANSLTDEQFDLAVDLTLKENLLLLYILVSVNSPLKVGFYKHALSVHDIVISFAPDLELTVRELGQQVIYYLTVISSGTRNGR
ncbi:MAG: hypothetical protein FWF53_06720 [Candidatus Azobacteroides sp.]|nr:hypothetical protein [Candidatus Azobacteroides sp.]